MQDIFVIILQNSRPDLYKISNDADCSILALNSLTIEKYTQLANVIRNLEFRIWGLNINSSLSIASSFWLGETFMLTSYSIQAYFWGINALGATTFLRLVLTVPRMLDCV